MKRSASTALVALLASLTSNAAVVISEGNTVVIPFDLSDVSPSWSNLPLNSRLGFRFVDFLPEESFRITIFEDQLASGELFTAVYSGGTGNSFYDFTPGFVDLDGAFAITMLSGSASLDEFFVSITKIDGDFYSKKFPNVTIPEPNIVAILLVSASMMAGKRSRTRRSRTSRGGANPVALPPVGRQDFERCRVRPAVLQR